MQETKKPLAQRIARTIAEEIGAQTAQALAAIALLDEGASVPFIARYRKEVTGGLDDTQLRNLETRLTYLRELEDRRATVLASIEGQGKLTDALRAEIEAADSKARLEDLYLPYKPKRRTRAQVAREAGLEPLADGLLADPSQTPETFAASFIDADRGVADAKAAFGAFVDIGVHQDGLVHISALSDTYVKDPRDVVKAGDIVKVRVLEVDIPRKRIALTRRLEDVPVAKPAQDHSRRDAGSQRSAKPEQHRKPAAPAIKPQQPPINNALAAAFARAKSGT